jgi:hypothetical protein
MGNATKLIKLIFNVYVFIFLVIIICSSFISTILQNNEQYDISIDIKFLDNILRVLAGAAAGGLLTVLVLNHATRIRADQSYKAIIWRLVELSGAAYVDILGNIGKGEFVNGLFGSGYGPQDGSSYIQETINLLKIKAKQFEKVESPYYKPNDKNDDIGHIYGYYKYDRSIGYIKDLTNIYYRDAINNTTDEYILEELYHCTNRGLILLGLLEGDFKQSSRLWSFAFFLELNLRLYIILLGRLGVNTEKEIKVSGARP